MSNILVLDIGSSSTRAMLFDERANLISGAITRRTVDFLTGPDGRSEDDAEQAFTRVAECLDDLFAYSSTPHALGISAYACSLVCLDKHGTPLTPVFTYADTRSAPYAQQLRARVDEMAAQQRTGCRVRANYLPGRIEWIRQTMPDVFRRTRWFAALSDYICLRLFGKLRAGISVWSWSGLLNRQQRTWDAEWLRELDISAEQLPPLAQPGEWIEGLRPEYAERWPALKDIRCLPAVGDGAAANIGSGCVDDRRIAVTIGSTAAIRLVGRAVSPPVSDTSSSSERGDSPPMANAKSGGWADSPSTDVGIGSDQRRANSPPYIPVALWGYRVDHARELIGGATTEGGNVFAWLRRTLQLPEPQALEQAMQRMLPDAHGLTVLPLFAGERSPGYSEDSRATLHGLTLNTEPAQIARACLEAVAYRLGMIYDDVCSAAQPSAPLIASGGALLVSPTWRQIIADVTGTVLHVCEEPEATSRGVAMLVLERLDKISSIGELPTQLGAAYVPDMQRHAVYRAAMARQQALYQEVVKPSSLYATAYEGETEPPPQPLL
jgi:gluconokinase